MSAQVPFRDSMGATAFLAPLGTANLFSSVTQLPDLSGLDQRDSGGSHDTHEDAARSLNVQEKNRRAQKRFRERQKAKMKDMTEQLDDMSGELGKLRMENNSLKNRNSILEKVLALRDEHIRVLQDEQQVFDLGSHFLQNSAPCGAPKLLPGRSALDVTAVTASDVKAIKAMPAEVVINSWKDMVRELGNILVLVEGFPDKADGRHQEAMDELCRVLDTAGQLCMHTAVLHPTNMQRLISATLDDGRSGVSADDRGRWAEVTASLHLDADQKAQIVALRAIFLHRMSRVMEQRRDVMQRLQAVTIPDRMVALQSVISETLQVNEATTSLKANLQDEHLAGMEFIGTVFKTILSPLQKARIIVQSYPFYPDMLQIAHVLAAQEGVKSALTIGLSQAPSAVPMDAATLIDVPNLPFAA